MTPAARERLVVRLPLLAISASAWLLLAAGVGSTGPSTHRRPMTAHAMSSAQAGASRIDPAPSAMAGWTLMLAAMMTPVVAAPIGHVRTRSFARRRSRAVALFVIGYVAVWLAAAFALFPLSTMAHTLAPGSGMPFALAAFVAVAWQCSPLKQRALNRCHARRELAAFGVGADLDAIRFGATHGFWCVASCWAMMLLPSTLPLGHIAAMAAVACWMAAERLEPATTPAWALRTPRTAARAALARLQMRRP